MRISFARHQFPPTIIRHAVWLYFRFTLSFRDVEDLLAERMVRSVARATTLNKEAATQALESAQPDFAEA